MRAPSAYAARHLRVRAALIKGCCQSVWWSPRGSCATRLSPGYVMCSFQRRYSIACRVGLGLGVTVRVRVLHVVCLALASAVLHFVLYFGSRLLCPATGFVVASVKARLPLIFCGSTNYWFTSRYVVRGWGGASRTPSACGCLRVVGRLTVFFSRV